MARKDGAYDAVPYGAVFPINLIGTGTGGADITGASGQSNKFIAFADMLVKSVTTSARTVGTSTVASNGVLLYKVSNNGTTAVNTTTTTYTLSGTGIPGGNGSAVTTAAYMVNYVGTGTLSAGIPFSRGDLGYIAKGTDATEVLIAQLECSVTPGASLTL